MTTGLALSQCKDRDRWNEFVSASPHGSVFARTEFLTGLGGSADLWHVEDHGVPLLGTVVLKDDLGEPMRAPFPFSLYQGLLLGPRHAGLPVHRRVNVTLGLVEFLLAELERRYDRIALCVHPRFEDLRAVTWFNYHEPERGRFRYDVAYTGWIALNAHPDFETYLATVRQTRRYEYRRALAAGLRVEPSTDIDLLVALYRRMFARQGLDRPAATERRLRALTAAALDGGFGEFLVCRTPAGEPASATVFLYDRCSAYYLVAANDPAFRETAAGTLLMLENIRRCFERGLERVDVLGINSPSRGDFKTSFSAAPVGYLLANWERPGPPATGDVR